MSNEKVILVHTDEVVIQLQQRFTCF
uniref:Uncharacterized protein n=1 Tax=Nelumbo nucifera TaxID=4432 RepID=A0A822YCN3_NELNU|nr:TPA_asm: hypothetical protein HUJ06_009201 [Nelumbo nucifera]